MHWRAGEHERQLGGGALDCCSLELRTGHCGGYMVAAASSSMSSLDMMLRDIECGHVVEVQRLLYASDCENSTRNGAVGPLEMTTCHSRPCEACILSAMMATPVANGGMVRHRLKSSISNSRAEKRL